MKPGNGTRLAINEVATRDGFQMESRFIATDDKVALIDRLGTLGYAKVEVTSFTSPKAIPALSDAEEVMQRIARASGVVYTALVPDVRGGERALASRFADLGVQGITLCDTTGMAYPTQAAGLCETALARHPQLDFTAHFHNTRAMGRANSVAAAEAGIRRFDTSLGGIGGCPYAPGATGNVATEDVVHMFDCMGYDTGTNLDGLIEAAGQLRSLIDHDLSAQVSRAGPRLTRHAPAPDFAEVRARALARH